MFAIIINRLIFAKYAQNKKKMPEFVQNCENCVDCEKKEGVFCLGELEKNRNFFGFSVLRVIWVHYSGICECLGNTVSRVWSPF